MGRVLSDSDNDQTALYQNANDRRSERAVTSFDASRRASFLGVWEIPFLKGQRGPVGMLFAGWQLSGTLIMQSGMPFNVTNTAPYPRGDYNADGTGGDRPKNTFSRLKRDGI